MRTYLITFLCILFLQQGYSYAQHSLSIYEYGVPITDYEDNFKNFINNWNTRSVTNANDYEILECTFVETISTWDRYNHYRNYFSSDQALLCSTSGSSSFDNKGNKKYEFIIKPGYAHTEFYDTRGLPDNVKAILTDEFREKAKKLLSHEFNVDTMNLYNYNYHEEKQDTTRSIVGPFYSYGLSRSIISRTINTPDSLTKNYMDVLEGRKTIYDLSTKEAQDVILEDLTITRLNQQLSFNNLVKTGDKVFVIKFKYDHQLYSNYIICSAETKKVIWDYMFNQISMDHLTSN